MAVGPKICHGCLRQSCHCYVHFRLLNITRVSRTHSLYIPRPLLSLFPWQSPTRFHCTLYTHSKYFVYQITSVKIFKSLLKTHLFFHSICNIVLRHEHNCGMAQYKSNDGLIDFKDSLAMVIYFACKHVFFH